MNKLELIGTKKHRCFLIRVDGKDIYVSPKEYGFLLILARAFDNQGWLRLGDGWVDRSQFGPNYTKDIWKMRNRIQQVVPDWPVVQNDRAGHYRLWANPTDTVLIQKGDYKPV